LLTDRLDERASTLLQRIGVVRCLASEYLFKQLMQNQAALASALHLGRFLLIFWPALLAGRPNLCCFWRQYPPSAVFIAARRQPASSNFCPIIVKG
jgi:hypothetical protein